MVSSYSLDEKIKALQNTNILNDINNCKKFIRYFVNLMEGVLNYEYDNLHTYFEEDKTVVEIEIINYRYELTCGGMKDCYISACIKLCREDYSYPKLKVIKLKVADKFFNYELDIDNFIYGSLENDDKFITDYIKIIRSQVFKDFKYNWSCNKNKIFKQVIKDKNITPSQYIVDCINNFVYNNIIKPKYSMMYSEFLNSEFKFDVDKKTQHIHDKYFFNNI